MLRDGDGDDDVCAQDAFSIINVNARIIIIIKIGARPV